ncbi:hypothetical protein ACLBXM_21765 [Xanthobacteraceae bacterium A53D]
MSTFIVSTPLAQMQPHGSEGERSHARLTGLLLRYLSPEHAALFADPVPLRNGSGIDWYVDEYGDARPLSALPDGEGAALRAELERRLADIRAKADEMDAAGGSPAAVAALRTATVFPGDTCLYALRTAQGLQPVLVGWGYQAHDPGVARSFRVTALGDAAPLPVPAPAPSQPGAAAAVAAAPMADPVPRRPFPWAWLLGLLLLLAAGLLLLWLIIAHLLPACGLRTPFGPISFGSTVGCQTPAAAPQLPSTPELERELAVLRQQLADRQQACAVPAQPVLPVVPVPVVPAPPVPLPAGRLPAAPAHLPNTFDERVDRRGQAQVTLIWDNSDDLDLMVQCPSGEQIFFGHRHACGGELDIDRNDSPANMSRTPVENITFANGLQEPGKYSVFVKLFRSREHKGPVPYKLRIRKGDEVREYEGRADFNTHQAPIAELQHP